MKATNDDHNSWISAKVVSAHIDENVIKVYSVYANVSIFHVAS